MRRPFSVAALLVVLFASAAASVAIEPPGPAQRLHALFDREWQWRLQEWPELATAAGVHDFDDKGARRCI